MMHCLFNSFFCFDVFGACVVSRGLCIDTGDKTRAAQSRDAIVCTRSWLISLAVISQRDYKTHGTDLAGAGRLTRMLNSPKAKEEEVQAQFRFSLSSKTMQLCDITRL